MTKQFSVTDGEGTETGLTDADLIGANEYDEHFVAWVNSADVGGSYDDGDHIFVRTADCAELCSGWIPA